MQCPLPPLCHPERYTQLLILFSQLSTLCVPLRQTIFQLILPLLVTRILNRQVIDECWEAARPPLITYPMGLPALRHTLPHALHTVAPETLGKVGRDGAVTLHELLIAGLRDSAADAAKSFLEVSEDVKIVHRRGFCIHGRGGGWGTCKHLWRQQRLQLPEADVQLVARLFFAACSIR